MKTDPVHTERCECGCVAINHSLCFWLWKPGMDGSPIGACGSCEDCHAYIGPEDSVLLSIRDIPYLGHIETLRVHDHPLTSEEIADKATASEILDAICISEAEIEDARRAVRAVEEKDMRTSLGPPELPFTRDNWKLTPMTAKQFSFIYEALTRERAEKAKLIDAAIRGIPALEGAMPKDVQAHEIPVLTWASPKEMERLIEFAHRMREERNEARLIAGTLKGMIMKQGTSKAGVEQAIRDVLALGKQINRNLIFTPAIRGHQANSGFVGKVPTKLPENSS